MPMGRINWWRQGTKTQVDPLALPAGDLIVRAFAWALSVSSARTRQRSRRPEGGV